MRRIVFEDRAVDTRFPSPVEVYEIDEVEGHFAESVMRIMEQLKLAEEMRSQGKMEEADEILRSQVVFVESAYDYYLHEVLRLGIVNLYQGNWDEKGAKYLELELSLRTLKRAIEADGGLDWLKEWITEKYSYITLMDYELFRSEVCGLLGINIREVAELAFYEIGGTEKPLSRLEREIQELYKRRNQIAHQSDRRMGTAEREEITLEYVVGKINAVRKVVLAISEIVREKGKPSLKIGEKIGVKIKDLYKRLVILLDGRIIELSNANT